MYIIDAIRFVLFPKLRIKKHFKQVLKEHHILESKRYDLKVVVLGSAAVGKTSIIRSICDNHEDCKYKPTIHEVYRKEIELGDTVIHLEFVDTAGLYSFPAMRKLYIEQADSFILVHACENQESLKEVSRILEEIRQIRGREVHTRPSILIVRNKVDLINSKCTAASSITNSIRHRRHGVVASSSAVASLTCSNLTSSYKTLDTSVHTGYNVHAVVEHILEHAKDKHTPSQGPHRKISGRLHYKDFKRSQSFRRLPRRLSYRRSNSVRMSRSKTM